MAKPSSDKLEKKVDQISRQDSSNEFAVKGDSLDMMDLMDKADQDFYAGNYRKALLKYEKILKIEPDLQRAQDNFKRSMHYLETGDIPDEDLPKDIKDTFRQAQSAARSGEYQYARKYILEALKQSRSAGIWKWVRGELFLQIIEKAMARHLIPLDELISRYRSEQSISIFEIRHEIRENEAFWRLCGGEDDLRQLTSFVEEFQLIEMKMEQILSDSDILFAERNFVNTFRFNIETARRFIDRHRNILEIRQLYDRIRQIEDLLGEYDQLLRQIRLALETYNFESGIGILGNFHRTYLFPEKLWTLRQEIQTRLELQREYYELINTGKHYLDVEEFQFAMDIFSRANLLANTSLPQEPNDLIKNTTHIIPDADLRDALNLFEEAKTLFDELEGLKSQLSFAQLLITQEGSCTAFDELIKLTKETPRGKRAAAIVNEAKVLQKNAMLLCADKMFKQGGYQKAKEILQPYANEDDRFPPEIAKISERQNREMKEKEQQKKELMDDIKKDDRRWSALGLAASILGGVLLISGVIGAFIGQTSAGIVSSMSAIFPGLVVALYYNRSDKIRSDRLRLIEKSVGEEQLDLDVVRKAAGLAVESVSEEDVEEE